MKRAFDLVFVLVSMPIWGIMILFLVFLVRAKLGTPIFFKQLRPGKQGKPFKLIKFRTMTDAKDTNGRLLPDEQRLTPFGTFLRSSSLDELPELWNVLKGEMSLVGPRPLLMQYLDRYTPEQAQRHDILPGITGWAQINGRNAISWEEKFKLDVWYVQHHSLRLDLKILLLTLIRVIKKDNISQANHPTSEEFKGTDKE